VRAVGYGFPGIVVDGNDLFAVVTATRYAVARARAGDGPTLIESRCHRYSFHNTADNPKRYRTEAEVAAARKDDPIERVRRYLMGAGALDEEGSQAMTLEVDAEIEAAVKRVRAVPRQTQRDIFKHVFAEETPTLRRQREQLERVYGISRP
jgi:pyruvate dehydrogenase E1 component alpha subunit